MVTAGDIIKASRALPASQQMSYITSASQSAVNASSSSLPKGAVPGVNFSVSPTAKSSSSSSGSSSSSLKGTVFDTSDPFGLNVPKSSSTPKAVSTTSTAETSQVNNISPEMGMITAVRHDFSNNNIQVKVTYKNTSSVMREVRAYLYTSTGDRVDKEPDTYYANVNPGNSYTITLTSSWTTYNINDFGGAYRVSIFSEGGIFIDERVVYLTTGEVSNPSERQGSTPINPDTSPVVPNTSTTPVQPTSGTGSWLDNLLGGSSGGTNYVLIGALILGAYLIGGRKK